MDGQTGMGCPVNPSLFGLSICFALACSVPVRRCEIQSYWCDSTNTPPHQHTQGGSKGKGNGRGEAKGITKGTFVIRYFFFSFLYSLWSCLYHPHTTNLSKMDTWLVRSELEGRNWTRDVAYHARK